MTQQFDAAGCQNGIFSSRLGASLTGEVHQVRQI